MNFYLKPKETIVYKVGGLSRLVNNLLFKIISFILIIAGWAGIIYIAAAFTGFVELNFKLLGLALLLIGLMLYYLAFSYFYRGFLIHPESYNLDEIVSKIKEGERINLWRIFSLELSLNLALAGIDGVTQTDSQQLVMAILKSREVVELLIRLAVPGKELRELISRTQSKSDQVASIYLKSLEIAAAEGHQQIETGDFFLALALIDPGLKEAIFRMKIEPSDIANVIYWQTKVKRRSEARRRIFDQSNLALTGGIGRDWAYGYTLTLDQYSKDLSELAKVGGLSGLQLEAKDREISQIEETLTRSENHNIVLVGAPGIGKKTTIYGLAKKIFNGQTTGVLANRRLLELDAEAILAGAGSQGEVIQRIRSIFGEAANAGNIILFIDDLASITSGDDKVGRVNAVEAIIPFLDSSSVYLIGTLSPKDYKNYFAPNQFLSSHFVKVDLHEPNFDETIRIVEDVLPRLENRTGSLVSYEAIKEAVKLTDKFVQNLPQPEKTINLIDQVATKKASEGGGILLPSDIDETLTAQTNVPVGDLESNEKEVLLKLEDTMHERVVGQKEAISAIANALRRARAGVVDSKKPIGSFLFLGPTGVGKTETAKTLADLYFGSESSMIRFDMSEYQQTSDLYRLLGDPQDETRQGALTSAVREKPFSLLLFDEIEKADPQILNLFLQILDEGSITDSFDQKCSFQNTIIILTSNAGSEFIRESSKQVETYEEIQKGLIDFVQKENLFRPEFLNRFTQVVVFKPLTLPEINQVAHFLIEKLSKTLNKERGVFITVDEPAIAKLADLGYDPDMGARPMQRSIQEHLENVLAKKILSGELNRGDRINIGLGDLE
jgi:ATP-dependent Clp protease ATP-binding subunit ClpC